MNGRIIGFRFDNTEKPELCAAAMQRMLRRLVAGGATYDLFLYPYADALLLADENRAAMFGTHALLWGFDPRPLAKAAFAACEGADLRPKALLLENDARAVAGFLSENVGALRPGELAVGGFGGLLAGSIRPWSIREHSRHFCSFCEQTARMSGVEAVALSGGRLVVRCGAEHEKTLADLYTAKTGGIPEVTR